MIVLEHQYTEGQDEITLFEGATSAGDIITFSEPCHSLVASGFTITEQGANYAIVSSGSGKLTGKKYVHSTREVKGKRTQARDAGQNESKIRVEEATLVSLVNSRAVADRLADYYACSERIIADVAYQADDAGDVLSQYHPYDGDMVQTCIESLDITLSGKLLAKMTALVGYIPPDISQIEYYDTFEILTGSGTWNAPSGAKNGRAVLIGSGTSGQPGEDGKPGVRGTRSGAAGGAGGLGGKAGVAGKILQQELDFESLKSYSYNCGSNGTETTFGAYTSANGAISEIGYTNPLNATTYAIPGKGGTNGGKGGAAKFSQEEERSESGEDVGDNKGGLGGHSYYNGPNDTGEDQQNIAGGGGGAAVGNNGKDANDAKIWEGTPGADGASATSPTSPTTFGSGGNGGHGGGGGGGGGCYYNLVDSKVRTESGGVGGTGSAGTSGKSGCVIVYYSLPRKENI